MINIQIINKSNNELPKYETEGSAGMDLRAFVPDGVVIAPFSRKIIQTGLSIQLPKGYEAQIRSRSGLAAKHGIFVLNSPGTIDSDYRGEVCVILMNLSNFYFSVSNGDRIAQMVIAKHEVAAFSEVKVLDNTDRGECGFGHTGKN